MGRKYKRFAFFTLFSVFLTVFAAAENEGITLFEQNQPAQAIAFLEKDIQSGNALPVEYNYLGIAYYQIGNYRKSIDTFKKGLSAPGTSKKTLYFNLGNTYFAMGDLDQAIENYSMACVASPDYAKAFLNRANAELKKNLLNEACDDYEKYLEMETDSPQRENIELVISLIRKELDERAEEQRLYAEEQKRIEEEERRLAEAKEEAERREQARLEEEMRIAEQQRASDEERRRKLLEDVANSLKQSSDTTNMSADAENSLDYNYESDID